MQLAQNGNWPVELSTFCTHLMPFVTFVVHSMIRTSKESEFVGTEIQLDCTIEYWYYAVYLILDLPFCGNVYGYHVIVVYIWVWASVCVIVCVRLTLHFPLV